jgi:hypothetical protein
VAVIAALFVAAGGAYAGLPDVDPWMPSETHGSTRARRQWWRIPLARDGAAWLAWWKPDGATSEARTTVALRPRWRTSDAWAAFDLPVPPRTGGWVRGICGGWSCHVEQGRYGHPAKKATWLYAVGVVPPTLKWVSVADISSENGFSLCGNKVKSAALMSKCRNHTGTDARPRISGKAASATPPEFRDVLLSIARSVS